jgi:arylsulfatase A-like enzyme
MMKEARMTKLEMIRTRTCRGVAAVEWPRAKPAGRTAVSPVVPRPESARPRHAGVERAEPFTRASQLTRAPGPLRRGCVALLSSFVLLYSWFTVASPARPPNIIFILADDLGWTDLGCQGSKFYQTPAIDRLASQGLRLTSFYVSQNCAPTRAALLTGQYPPRTGIYSVGELSRGRVEDQRMAPPQNTVRLPSDRRTIAEQLKTAGYATAMLGKWGLELAGDSHPLRRGFDEGFVTQGRHFDFTTDPPVSVPPGVYLADFLTDHALRFIERHKDRPFFLYLSHYAAHSPYQAKPELIERFANKPAAGGHRDPVYAAMIASLDESVARILAQLDALSLAERTVVIFASDNGGVGGYQEIGGRNITDNAPLRGGKGMLYEGGVRVPFLVRWPRVVRPGAVSDAPAVHVDLFPTLLEIAGAKPPPHQPLDGVSLASLFRKPRKKLARDAIYFHFPGYLEGYGTRQWRSAPVGFIRAGDFKLMEFFEEGRLELYNLKRDLGETQDLAARLPDKTRQLHAKLVAWRTDLRAAMPTAKPAPGPALIPQLDGDWWQLAGQPDLSELTSEQQEPVDFAVWQAADGTWQLWSCIRKTKEAGHTRLFHRWEGARLTDANWEPRGIAMRGDPKFGESPGGLQAPHVIRHGGLFHMFYGNWEEICHATSADGKHFTRLTNAAGKTGLFGEGAGNNTRDPMLRFIDLRWICYYTASPAPGGAVYARTSPDLQRWSDARIVNSGGRGNGGRWAYECPHVVERQGYFYLLRTERYGRNNLTHVFRSTDPLNFGRDEDARYWITSLPVAAPEIVTHEGQDYLATLNPELNGIRLVKLKWVPAATAKERQ